MGQQRRISEFKTSLFYRISYRQLEQFTQRYSVSKNQKAKANKRSKKTLGNLANPVLCLEEQGPAAKYKSYC